MEDRAFFMVWKEHGHMPNVKHYDFDSAKIEAERLARLNPGEDFYVLKSQKGYTMKTPVAEFDVSEELPF